MRVQIYIAKTFSFSHNNFQMSEKYKLFHLNAMGGASLQ